MTVRKSLSEQKAHWAAKRAECFAAALEALQKNKLPLVAVDMAYAEGRLDQIEQTEADLDARADKSGRASLQAKEQA